MLVLELAVTRGIMDLLLAQHWLFQLMLHLIHQVLHYDHPIKSYILFTIYPLKAIYISATSITIVSARLRQQQELLPQLLVLDLVVTVVIMDQLQVRDYYVQPESR